MSSWPPGGGGRRQAASDVEFEVDDVAIDDDVVLALHANLAAGLRLGHASGVDEVVVADGIFTGPSNRDIDFGGKAITVRSVPSARRQTSSVSATMK